MKLRKRIWPLLIMAALLVELLAGCHPQNTEIIPREDPTESPSQRQDSHIGLPANTPNLDNPDDEPDPGDALWDPDHHLPYKFIPADGLELEVFGATGYASVSLPMWEMRPEGDECKLANINAGAAVEPTEDPNYVIATESEPVTTEPPAVADPPADTAPVDPAPTEPDPAPAVPSPADPPPADPAPAESSEETAYVDPQSNDPGAPIDVTMGPTDPDDDDPGIPIHVDMETPTPATEPTPAPDPTPTPEPTPTPVPTPTPEPTPEPTLEPPPTPAPDPTPVPGSMDAALMVLEPGTAFLILDEIGDWWMVRVGEYTGWIEHRYCLINLPDVVPSIIYNATNSYASKFISSGKQIPNITGQALYHGAEYNARLGRTEYMMPVLYTMAKHISQAQQAALAEGNSLILYEGYRPTQTQIAVYYALSALAKTDPVVKAGISTRPWNVSWFIATGKANHQEGYAIDVSLAKITESHATEIDGCNIVQIDAYTEYTMPTPIHELSMAAATYTAPVTIYSGTAWKKATMTDAMAKSKPALALQRYCTSTGVLTPLASEWWHFNDLEARNEVIGFFCMGNFEITQCLSVSKREAR